MTRWVVVTGSASGMGAAACGLLREQGHDVVGVDRCEADVVADLGTDLGRRRTLSEIRDLTGGSIGGLVCCAGVAGIGDRPGSSVVAVNYFGTVDLVRALQPELASDGSASVVVIGSNAATTTPDVDRRLVDALLSGSIEAAAERADEVDAGVAYAASKLALAWWVRRNAPSSDWIGSGVTLNVLAPGLVETSMVHEVRADPVGARILAHYPNPLGRSADPREIAAIVSFLLGPAARLFVGSVLTADGGTEALIRTEDWPSIRAAPPDRRRR